MFITIEAVDGAGKSTQLRRLAEVLKMRGHDLIVTREPGGSPGAEDIRALLVSGEPERWSAMTEMLLFTAARRDHIERTIAPALAQGKIVISDRYADSTRIYQSARDPEMLDVVNSLHQLAIGLEPDLTLILDIDPELAWSRSMIRNDASTGPDEGRIEKRGLEFQKSLRDGFLQLAQAEPERIRVIDASGTEDEVFDRILNCVMQRLDQPTVAVCENC